jgi:hypothetical protein
VGPLRDLGRRGIGPIDYDAEYEIHDDTVVFHHSDGSNTYRWHVDHDTVTLHFVKSTLPTTAGSRTGRGVPARLYMTSTVTNQG